jgi:hypothetical protein
MSEVTYYVALPFVASDDGVAPGEAIECFNPNSAVMKAEALARKPGNVGAVAFRDRRLRRCRGDPKVRRCPGRLERPVAPIRRRRKRPAERLSPSKPSGYSCNDRLAPRCGCADEAGSAPGATAETPI